MRAIVHHESESFLTNELDLRNSFWLRRVDNGDKENVFQSARVEWRTSNRGDQKIDEGAMLFYQ